MSISEPNTRGDMHIDRKLGRTGYANENSEQLPKEGKMSVRRNHKCSQHSFSGGQNG